MALIYHIATKEEWDDSLSHGMYTVPSLKTEGFIHCSEGGQVAGVLQRYYAAKTGLVKLAIETEKLNVPVKYEMSSSVNEEFPHIYGPINLDAVEEVTMIQNFSKSR